MTNLTQYGFTKITETERWDEYRGHDDIIITVFHYPYLSSDGAELTRNTFVVSSKRYTSKSYPLSDLEGWLHEKKIVQHP